MMTPDDLMETIEHNLDGWEHDPVPDQLRQLRRLADEGRFPASHPGPNQIEVYVSTVLYQLRRRRRCRA